jgi:hypothetical protein
MLVLEMGPSASGSGSGSVSIKQRVFAPDTDPDPDDPIASSLAASREHADQGPANGIGLFLCPRLRTDKLDRKFGVGPEISAFWPKLGLFMSVRYAHEFAAVERPEGDLITLTLTKPF